MENIFMTNVDIIRRLSIRYGKGELIEVSPGCPPPYWRAILPRILESNDQPEITIEYWLQHSGRNHPPLHQYATPGFEFAAKENDRLFAAIIPPQKNYLWPDDKVSPKELWIHTLSFQLDIHNGPEQLNPSIQSGVRLYLGTGQLELVG